MEKKLVRDTITLLENKRMVFSVLGSLCEKPSLLKESYVKLSPNDFQDQTYRIVFTAINNIIKSDGEIKKITAEDIDNYISSYPEKYKTYSANSNRGFKIMKQSIESANISLFRSNYKRLKKFALLRHYHEFGFDIRTLYDYEKAITDFKYAGEINEKLDKLEEKEIINHFTLRALKAMEEWSTETGEKSIKVKDKIAGLSKRKAEEPELGLPYLNKKYNSLMKGKNYGRLFCRSADTGNGKSRLMMSDCAYSACDMWYDYKKGWVRNGNREKCLYISTELDERDILTMLLASVSGVGTGEINLGNFSQNIETRLIVGEEILGRSEIFIEEIDDFDVSDISALIEKHIIENGITEVYFDYIQVVPKLSRTMTELFGFTLREDQILVYFAQALKKMAERFNVFISTSTQLSRAEEWDARKLAGGKATANKIDHGVIITKTTNELMKKIGPILKSSVPYQKPNYAHFIYKNRLGEDTVIIWTKMNLGCAREEYCFCTDYNYNLINIQDLDIEVSLIDYTNQIIVQEEEQDF